MSVYDNLSETDLKDKIIERVKYIDRLVEEKKEMMKQRNEEIKAAKQEQESMLTALGQMRLHELQGIANRILEESIPEEQVARNVAGW